MHGIHRANADFERGDLARSFYSRRASLRRDVPADLATGLEFYCKSVLPIAFYEFNVTATSFTLRELKERVHDDEA